ncbi:hypothetical protein AGMMS50268_29440 [Spirochaetia bacterium]|nr:hypothetical protein AGMMS50268_29440 [Spirochaetia bacterium]
MSDFGTATLDLRGKADFRPLFQEPVPKLTEFWNRLRGSINEQKP